MSLLRVECPLLTREGIVGRDVAEVLRRLRETTVRLNELLGDPAATTRQVLDFAVANDLLQPDDRYTPYLADPDRAVDADDPESGPVTAFLAFRSEEHTSELQSLMRISYAVFCLKNNKTNKKQ